MVWKGDRAVLRARNLIGKTDPASATAGTIRADMAAVPGRNVVHGSDSVQSAEKEIWIWFGNILTDWEPALKPWIEEEQAENNAEEQNKNEGENE